MSVSPVYSRPLAGLVLCLVGLSRAPSLWPQAGSAASLIEVSGRVLDEDGNPLRGTSTVRLEGEDGLLIVEMMTDLEGKFHVPNVPTHLRPVVVVTREGYVPTRERLWGKVQLRKVYLLIQLRKSATLRQELPLLPRVEVDYLNIPRKARREHEKAIREASKGNYPRAVEHLEKAVALYPQFPRAMNDLGSFYLRQQKMEPAERSFRRAIELDKNFAAPLFNLGLLSNRQGRYADAEQLLQRFLALEKDSWRGYLQLAYTYYQTGRFAEAAADLKEAQRLNPKLAPEVHVQLADAYLGMRQFERALAEMELYLKKAPEGPWAERVRTLMEKVRSEQGVTARP